MVSQEPFLQGFIGVFQVPKVSIDDVLLLVDGDIEQVSERFKKLPFLPDYLGHKTREITLYKVNGMLDERRAKELQDAIHSDKCHFRVNDESNIRSNFALAQMFATLAFRLFELLQDEDSHPITWDVLDSLNVMSQRVEVDGGIIECSFYFNIPPCDYLQFISDGCEKLLNEWLFCDCYLHPVNEKDGKDPILGWLMSEHGAQLSYTQRVLNNKKAPRTTANYLLKFLLDLHLHDVQVTTYGIGEYSLLSAHSLSAVWVALREELSEGRAGVCRVCGRHFVAKNERKEKTRYCIPNGSCSRKYRRTRSTLNLMNEGSDIKEAAKVVGNISPKTVAKIAIRNRYDLEREFPNVDFDQLGKGL